MARIQILELPTEHHGDDMVTPFVLVIDQHVRQRHVLGPDHVVSTDPLERIAEQVGARAVVAFEETIEIPANEVPVDPDGYPLKIRVEVEGDFEQFHEQVQAEISKAQEQIARARIGS
ncbi:hypothetical protein [Wenjunlia vitaminophila]|uniref:hypothetical protein n=1 Tax=Wenjunlia vitaminophila TaxID=76728 RepID=UPI00036215E3|nr:hypothetical protein [Wenjunlia vitaminophila]